ILLDVHWLIYKKFGRYTHKNTILGRACTQKEVVWVEETHHFAETSPDVSTMVKEDVRVIRWAQSHL
ncbi:hypothetical protein BDP81DRAFT_505022, partial [Colletotrichum phormii]